MLDETKLFDFVKIMFTKRDSYANVKESSKKRHHFMINRFMSIKFPANAQLFNFNGINGSKVIDSWQMVASRFNKVPGWIYTRTKSSNKIVKEKYQPSDEALRFYMKKTKLVREK